MIRAVAVRLPDHRRLYRPLDLAIPTAWGISPLRGSQQSLARAGSRGVAGPLAVEVGA